MSAVPERPMILTAGVVRRGDAYELGDAGWSVSMHEEGWSTEMLEYGLASEEPRFRPSWLADTISPRSRAVRASGSILQAILQSFGHNAVGMIRWWLAVAGLCLAGAGASAPSLIAIGCAGGLLFLAVLVHEAGHVAAYRLVAGSSAVAVLVSRGATCYLVRPALTASAERWVIVSGPLAPGLVVLVLIPTAFIAPFIFWAWSALAAGHALCLLLPVGDGLNLRRSFAPAETSTDMSSGG